jgi:8-oxo-dGTP pyrophosphatase MutT (NUDIX family)
MSDGMFGRLPAEAAAHVRALASGEAKAAEPRHASTVVLLRDRPDGMQSYLLRRTRTMAFAAGMYVFPGGSVDPRDETLSDQAWAGPPPAAWARLLSADEALTKALVCAAVRETFEESGVLLAGSSSDDVVADTTGDEWEADRRALEAKELAFTAFLERRGLVLRTDLLGVWSAWCTPVFEPRRFRTWFFVAALPPGQLTRDVSTESSSVTWLSARGACDAVDAGELGMLPPTYFTCLEIAQHDSPDDVLAAAPGRNVEMFTPTVEGDGADATLSMPTRMVALVEARRA